MRTYTLITIFNISSSHRTHAAPKKAQKMSLNEFLGDEGMYTLFSGLASNSWTTI